MSESKGGFPTGLPLLGILLFLGASGLFLRPSALKQLRPPPTNPLWAESAEDGSAAARLWQDPLQAIGSAYDRWRLDQTTRSSKPAGDADENIGLMGPPPDQDVHLVQRLRARATGLTEPWTIVVSIVSGSNYSDSESTRLDNRVAVGAALGELGFVPEDREKLNFFVWNPLHGRGPSDIAVPYEWFRRENADRSAASGTPGHGGDVRSKNVLLMWLRSDAIAAKQPLASIEQLLETALRGVKRESLERADIVILTSGSNRLIDIATELATASRPHSDLDAPMRVIDWSATISPPQLTQAIVGRVSNSQGASDSGASPPVDPDAALANVVREAQNRRVTVERRIGTDDELMRVIVDELALRGIVPGRDNTHIAVVHEWDTAYGRALPATLKSAIAASDAVKDAFGITDGAVPQERLSEIVHTYSYLQGVDGVLPVPGGRSDGGAGGASSGGGAPATETPEGRNQLDYIRRLAGSIRRDHSAELGRKRIAAIGVFGVVYDKVPVLQALRAEFPGALLFTTDLDGRLVHASADGSLRNLLIASHFGLRAGLDEQPHSPPFRSSYQTSLYLATRHAFTDGTRREAGGFSIEGVNGLARVYEIGRTGVHDLLTPASGNSETQRLRESLHPRTTRPVAVGGWTLVGGSMAIAAVIILVHYVRRVARPDAAAEQPNEPITRGNLVTAFLATALASLAVTLWHSVATSSHPLARGFLGASTDDVLEASSTSFVASVTMLIPDVVLLVATVAFARLAFLAACARIGRTQRVGIDDDEERLAGSEAFRTALTIAGFLLVLVAACARLWRLDEISPWVRAAWGGAAVLIAVVVRVALTRAGSNVRSWLGANVEHRILLAAVLPVIYLGVLLPRLLPVAASMPTALRDGIALAPPFLAMMGSLTAILTFLTAVLPRSKRSEAADILRARNWAMLATAILAFVAISFGIERFDAMPNQEPVALWEGISAWPSIALRVVTVILGIWFLSIIRDDARSNGLLVTRNWDLLDKPTLTQTIYGRLPLLPLPFTVGWNEDSVLERRKDRPDLTYGQAVWIQYLERGRDRGRFLRVAILFGLFVALVAPLLPEILAHAIAPYAVRGSVARWLHEASYLASLVVLVVLTLAVWDTSNLCQRFIALLSRDLHNDDLPGTSMWHPHSAALVTRRLGLRGEAADSYLTLRVIADRTRWASTTIYYPFILIVVLLVAGAGGFDAWPQSWRVIAAIGIATVIALIAARALQSSAKRLRDTLIERLARAVGTPIPALALAAGGAQRPLPISDALARLRAATGQRAIETVITPSAHDSALRPTDADRDSASAAPTDADDLIDSIAMPEWTEKIRPGLQVRCVIPEVEPAAAEDRLAVTLRALPTAPSGEKRKWRLVSAKSIPAATLTADDVKTARTAFDALRQGAFATYTDNPILRALLLPFGGFGAIQIVDYAMRVM